MLNVGVRRMIGVWRQGALDDHETAPGVWLDA
jgi:hypothetical protein